MESGSERSVHLLGPCRMRELTVIVQLFVLLTIIIVSLVNISITEKNRELFIALLTSATGVLLPSPYDFLRRRHRANAQEQQP